jgi:molecular chaperone GrpE
MIKENELNDEFEVDINTLKKDLEIANEKYLYKCAEFENYKKRVHKQKEDLVLETKTKMLSSILDMDSDISIAIRSIKNKDAKKGVSLIVSKLETFLKNQGIESIQTDIYDTDVHEVISIVNIGESKIIDVASKGYSINGKIFRYPKIIIGK